MKKRIREYGIDVGRMKAGSRNRITDVAGVKVGQVTVRDRDHRTGVTVILPGEDNPFTRKYTAACHVHNGYGKSAGLVQVEELGTLETPIALTNTLNVGLVWDGIVQYMIDRCAREGVALTSVNPVVGECNDSRLSRIRDRVVTQSHVLEAIRTAGADFEEGDVGAGAGTVCYGLKGGIGSASRVVPLGGREYVIGVLVQSNFGAAADLVLNGKPAGEAILRTEAARDAAFPREDRGSIMTVLATDLPVDSRQLRRILRRTAVGIARTGAYTGHGSGEVMLGFTTANRLPEGGRRNGGGRQSKAAEGTDALLTGTTVREDLLDPAFLAAAEATCEAILNSMVCADAVRGPDGKICHSLAEFLPEILREPDERR